MESICDIRAGNVCFFCVHRPLRDPNKTTETNRLKTGKYCFKTSLRAYQLKTTYLDDAAHVTFDPLNFMARLALMAPKPRGRFVA